MPGRLAGGHVESDEGGRIFVLGFRAAAAPVIDRGIAHGQIDETELFVPRRGRPHIRRAACIGLAFRRCARQIRIAEVPGPGEFAGHRVIAANDAGGRVLGLAVLDLSPRHHNAAHQSGRRRHRIPARHALADPVPEIDRAILAEVFAGLAGLGIDRDEARVERALDDPRGASLVFLGLRILEIGHAPTGRAIGNGVGGDFRIVTPKLDAGLGIERDEDVHRRAEIEAVADLQGRAFRRIFAFGRLGGHVAGAIFPGLGQRAHIVAGDAVKGRIALGARTAAPLGPVGADLALGLWLAGGLNGPAARAALGSRLG